MHESRLGDTAWEQTEEEFLILLVAFDEQREEHVEQIHTRRHTPLQLCSAVRPVQDNEEQLATVPWEFSKGGLNLFEFCSAFSWCASLCGEARAARFHRRHHRLWRPGAEIRLVRRDAEPHPTFRMEFHDALDRVPGAAVGVP